MFFYDINLLKFTSLDDAEIWFHYLVRTDGGVKEKWKGPGWYVLMKCKECNNGLFTNCNCILLPAKEFCNIEKQNLIENERQIILQKENIETLEKHLETI